MSSLRERRSTLIDDRQYVGDALCGPLADFFVDELVSLWSDAAPPTGWALAAVGGTARRSLTPGSDLDLIVLHDRKARPADIERVAQALWYPLWDADVRVGALVHSPESALDLARSDVAAATTLLDITPIAGNTDVVGRLRAKAEAQFGAKAKSMLALLRSDAAQRAEQFGSVAYLLEPDIKDGHGGLRDIDVLAFAARADAELQGDYAARADDVAAARSVLLSARVELHRVTRRASTKLLLQDQDAVAAALGDADADVLMRRISEAGHSVAWHLGRFWAGVDRRSNKSRRPERVAAGLVVRDAELHLDAPSDSGVPLALRAASVAAANGVTLSDQALAVLAASEIGVDEPWPGESRRHLIGLLGSGEAGLRVVEALDHAGLMVRILPEWAAVRCKPQRNAFHQFTVDRHLCRTAANAATLVRTVARPDLLLIGSWLHDIGKGYPGDHVEVGEALVRAIGERLGFGSADVEVLVAMERHHLLLPEVATRRDLDDPGTIGFVADLVGDADVLDLLHALTIADSLATGPSAWSDWKARLVADLVGKVRRSLAGHRIPDVDSGIGDRHRDLIDASRSGGIAVRPISAQRCVVVAPDRLGLFRCIAGVFALHSVDVVDAEIWTSEDGIAADEFEVRRRLGGDTNWKRVEADLAAASAERLDLETKLHEKAASYSRASRRALSAEPARTDVLVDNTWSATSTVVEVRAPDGVGVLHRVASVLEHLGLNIRKARVATLGHEVVDVFYVDRVEDADQLAQIEATIEAALSPVRS